MDSERTVSGTRTKIIPLAFPKGMRKVCEVCQRDAHLQCDGCLVTFYCGEEHQQADWDGIHEKICQLLVPIRSLTTLHFSEDNHSEKEELIEICRLVAQRKVSEGKHREAVPAAQFCLRCSIDVHGPNTVQLVPAYLLLAEVNMGLDNLGVVAELLSHAERAVLQSPECGFSVQHRLHRSLGRLNTATGNLEEALFHFANDIYFACEEYGLDSTVICAGYFLMANVFVKQEKMSVACSLYSQVVRTLHSLLTNLLKIYEQNIEDPAMSFDSSFDKSQQAEVDKILRDILEFEQQKFRKDPNQVAMVAHCLAILWFLKGDSQQALGFGSTALQASQLIPKHDLTGPVQSLLLQLVQDLQTDPQPGSG
ncbi:zinc finger MYND domain-containing protein 12 [Cololabis saira]|uniref:zinc finger MYND domain-containing protein 12 n=1 Tax=Cololabis saira TaxID=129043 RepID=UPI002AD2CB3D|nr:zinc finger MYND domain-containing protein 12 [Cololabis saira]